MIYDLKRLHGVKRVLRLNAKAPEHGLIFAPGVEIRLNADGALPEQIQIAPFGRHPTRDKSAVQVFDADSADQVISWFNFWPRKVARLANINAVKVWVGHPDFAPDQWPDRIELGSIIELNADEHGLNAKVRWNHGAMEHVKRHKFPSVAWDCEINGDGTETPSLLWSVGMWHKPNIKSVQAVINCACEDDETENTNPSQEEDIMLKDILTRLNAAGLIQAADETNPAAVLAQVDDLIQGRAARIAEAVKLEGIAAKVRTALNAQADVGELPDEELLPLFIERFNAATAEVAEKETQLNAAKAESEARNTARINTAVEKAMELGLVTKADEEAVRTQLNADFDAGISTILASRVQLNSSRLNLGGSKPGIVEAASRIARINAWVDEKTAAGMSYEAAWEASKTDPATKPLHEAMAAADQARSAGGGEA